MSLFALNFPPSAELSDCGQYRYTLRRQWSNEGDCVMFLMFNPSTADATVDDHTIRKCVGFAQQWGYGRMVVVNLFAIRSTDPAKCQRVVDPIGPMNDYHILKALADVAEVVCAWGCSSHIRGRLTLRSPQVLKAIEKARPDIEINCLGRSKNGTPRHPLMLPYSTPRESFAGSLSVVREGVDSEVKK